MKLKIEKKAVISSFEVTAEKKEFIEHEAKRLDISQAEVLRRMIDFFFNSISKEG